MTREDVATLLTYISGVDGRVVGDVNVAFWAETLADVELRDALRAAVAHYRESHKWLMPVDVIVRARRYVKDRQLVERGIVLGLVPVDWDPAEPLPGGVAGEVRDRWLERRSMELVAVSA